MLKIENKHTWGIKTAARLRAVHASFSDTTPDERSGYLIDEIEYALEDAGAMPGESRQSLLESLEAYFPVYGDDTAPIPPVQTETHTVEIKEPALATMVERICEKSRELTQAQMQKLAALVAELGNHSLGSSVPKAVTDSLDFPTTPAELDDCLRSVSQLWLEMGGADGDPKLLKLNRLVKMLGILTGGFRDLYRFLWPYWRELAPRELQTQVAPGFPDGLEAAIKSYVTGGEVNSRDFHAEIDKTKKVMLSILFGLRKGAEDYGKLYERKLSASAITDTVAMEESATDVNRVRELGRKCWDKYSLLTKHQTAEAIHDEIVRTVAEATFTKLKLLS